MGGDSFWKASFSGSMFVFFGGFFKRTYFNGEKVRLLDTIWFGVVETCCCMFLTEITPRLSMYGWRDGEWTVDPPYGGSGLRRLERFRRMHHFLDDFICKK